MADITIDKKTDVTIAFQYYESDSTTPRTLVGATVFFTVKNNAHDSSATDTSAVISKTVTSHTSAAAGQTDITLSDTQTDVTPKKYFYDIKVKEADGNIYLAQQGRLTLNSSVTNRTT